MNITIGQKFNKWTVLKLDKEMGPYGKFKYYLCQCECDNICSVRGYDLIKGSSKSCGCEKGIKRVDFTGQIINGITVIEEIEHKLWKVKCECGEIFSAKSSALSGKRIIQSCGCKTKKINSFNHSSNSAYLLYLYRFYKSNAVKRGLVFQLSLPHFESLILQKCYYCNIEPSNIFDGLSYKNKFLHNGVDRKNNSVGYIEDNCVPCCKSCNIAKYTMGEQQFYQWLKRTYNFCLISKRFEEK